MNLIDNLLFIIQNQRENKTTQYIISLLLLIVPIFKTRFNVFSGVLLLLIYITYVKIIVWLYVILILLHYFKYLSGSSNFLSLYNLQNIRDLLCYNKTYEYKIYEMVINILNEQSKTVSIRFKKKTLMWNTPYFSISFRIVSSTDFRSCFSIRNRP